jgi:hypothetical protein
VLVGELVIGAMTEEEIASFQKFRGATHKIWSYLNTVYECG